MKADVLARSDLFTRVISSVVLAPLAIVTAYIGGWAFLAFWIAAALAILWEWRRIVGDASGITAAIGIVAIGALAVSTVSGQLLWTLVVAALAVALACAAGGGHRYWAGAGILYAGLVVGGPLILRSDQNYGFSAIVFLFGIVWATDILGYFVGRFVGGPKL